MKRLIFLSAIFLSASSASGQIGFGVPEPSSLILTTVCFGLAAVLSYAKLSIVNRKLDDAMQSLQTLHNAIVMFGQVPAADLENARQILKGRSWKGR